MYQYIDTIVELRDRVKTEKDEFTCSGTPTPVFTHLPSNVLLAAVPFMPNLGLAVTLLFARSALSPDGRARPAGIHRGSGRPSEQTAAAAYTNTARYVGRPAGPTIARALMQRTTVAAPFLAAGAIKVVYDLVIYVAFRKAISPDRGDDRA